MLCQTGLTRRIRLTGCLQWESEGPTGARVMSLKRPRNCRIMSTLDGGHHGSGRGNTISILIHGSNNIASISSLPAAPFVLRGLTYCQFQAPNR